MQLSNILKALFVGFLFLTSQISFSQNLVLNPSFEDVNIPNLNCSFYTTEPQFQAAINFWDYPNQGSSDLYHMSLPTNCFGYPESTNSASMGQQLPQEGDAMVGIFTYGSGGCFQYREYVQGELSQDLTIGVTYYINFYVSLGEFGGKATNNIGVKFTTERQNINNMCVWATTPDANYDGAPITDEDGWTLLSFAFTPTEADLRYFSIGNFISDGGTATVDMPGGTYPQNAYYFIDNFSVSIDGNCTLDADAGAGQTIECGVSTATLNGSATGGTPPYSYSWTPTTGLSDPLIANPEASPTESTVYTLTVTDAASCASSSTVEITVTGLPDPPTTTLPNQTFCISENATLNDLEIEGTQILWYNNSTGGTALNPSSFEMISGTYYASQTVNGCESERISVDVTINPETVPDFEPVGEICEGGELSTLPTTSLNGISGTWSPALNSMSTTTYTFTPDADQCATSASLTIVVNPIIDPVFESLDPVCYGEGFSLPATSINGVSGTWLPEINSTQSTVYTFTPAEGACANQTSMEVVILEPLDFQILNSCVDGDFNLQVMPLLNSFDIATATISWELDDNVIDSGETLNLTDYINGSPANEMLPLMIKATVTTADGCLLTRTLTVESMYCNIQQGISPNGDGANDFFDLRLLEVERLTIYNRHGKQIYSKNNYTQEWYGQTDSGQEVPDGTYYYHITFKNDDKPKLGWIYVIR